MVICSFTYIEKVVLEDWGSWPNNVRCFGRWSTPCLCPWSSSPKRPGRFQRDHQSISEKKSDMNSSVLATIFEEPAVSLFTLYHVTGVPLFACPHWTFFRFSSWKMPNASPVSPTWWETKTTNSLNPFSRVTRRHDQLLTWCFHTACDRSSVPALRPWMTTLCTPETLCSRYAPLSWVVIVRVCRGIVEVFTSVNKEIAEVSFLPAFPLSLLV